MCESALVFCGTGSCSFAGSFLCLHLCLLMSGVSAARAEDSPGRCQGRLQHQSLPSVFAAAACAPFAGAAVANSQCVCMPTACFGELYFSPVVGLNLMVDLNLAYLLKAAPSPGHHLQREVTHHQEALEGMKVLKEWVQD